MKQDEARVEVVGALDGESKGIALEEHHFQPSSGKFRGGTSRGGAQGRGSASYGGRSGGGRGHAGYGGAPTRSSRI